MWRTLKSWLAAMLLGGVLAASAAAQPAENEGKRERGPPVPQYFAAFVVTVLVLAVVCIPSRK